MQRRIINRNVLRTLCVCMGMLIPLPGVGQVLDSIEHRVEDGQHQAQIRFTTKIAYLWHFPHMANTDFIITVRPLGNIDAASLSRRERTLIPPPLRDVVQDIYLESQSPTEWHLILHAPAATEINVRPGEEGASLIIGLTPTVKPVECPEQAPPAKPD